MIFEEFVIPVLSFKFFSFCNFFLSQLQAHCNFTWAVSLCFYCVIIIVFIIIIIVAWNRHQQNKNKNI